MIDTINDGTLYLREARPYEYFARKSANWHIYAVDHGVAFLNAADKGQLQHTKLCLLSSKTNCTILKWFKAHASPTIVANVNYRFW